MDELSSNDFRDSKLDPDCCALDKLAEVARVGLEKREKEKQSFKIKQEAMAFKRGKNLNKNGFVKRKLESNKEEVGGSKSKRKKRDIPSCPKPPPDLHESFKEHIVGEMGGSDLLLVIQKRIFFSDINPNAGRFSMPFSQIKSHEFLYENEAEFLEDKDSKGIEVRVLEPSLNETTLSFRRWNMRTSSSYVLTTMWNSVVKNNQIEIDDVLQLWSFRVESSLCFALVKVDYVQPGSEEINGQSESNENGASSSRQQQGQ